MEDDNVVVAVINIASKDGSVLPLNVYHDSDPILLATQFVNQNNLPTRVISTIAAKVNQSLLDAEASDYSNDSQLQESYTDDNFSTRTSETPYTRSSNAISGDFTQYAESERNASDRSTASRGGKDDISINNQNRGKERIIGKRRDYDNASVSDRSLAERSEYRCSDDGVYIDYVPEHVDKSSNELYNNARSMWFSPGNTEDCAKAVAHLRVQRVRSASAPRTRSNSQSGGLSRSQQASCNRLHGTAAIYAEKLEERRERNKIESEELIRKSSFHHSVGHLPGSPSLCAGRQYIPNAGDSVYEQIYARHVQLQKKQKESIARMKQEMEVEEMKTMRPIPKLGTSPAMQMSGKNRNLSHHRWCDRLYDSREVSYSTQLKLRQEAIRREEKELYLIPKISPHSKKLATKRLQRGYSPSVRSSYANSCKDEEIVLNSSSRLPWPKNNPKRKVEGHGCEIQKPTSTSADIRNTDSGSIILESPVGIAQKQQQTPKSVSNVTSCSGTLPTTDDQHPLSLTDLCGEKETKSRNEATDKCSIKEDVQIACNEENVNVAANLDVNFANVQALRTNSESTDDKDQYETQQRSPPTAAPTQPQPITNNAVSTKASLNPFDDLVEDQARSYAVESINRDATISPITHCSGIDATNQLNRQPLANQPHCSSPRENDLLREYFATSPLPTNSKVPTSYNSVNSKTNLKLNGNLEFFNRLYLAGKVGNGEKISERTKSPYRHKPNIGVNTHYPVESDPDRFFKRLHGEAEEKKKRHQKAVDSLTGSIQANHNKVHPREISAQTHMNLVQRLLKLDNFADVKVLGKQQDKEQEIIDEQNHKHILPRSNAIATASHNKALGEIFDVLVITSRIELERLIEQEEESYRQPPSDAVKLGTNARSDITNVTDDDRTGATDTTTSSVGSIRSNLHLNAVDRNNHSNLLKRNLDSNPDVSSHPAMSNTALTKKKKSLAMIQAGTLDTNAVQFNILQPKLLADVVEALILDIQPNSINKQQFISEMQRRIKNGTIPPIGYLLSQPERVAKPVARARARNCITSEERELRECRSKPDLKARTVTEALAKEHYKYRYSTNQPIEESLLEYKEIQINNINKLIIAQANEESLICTFSPNTQRSDGLVFRRSGVGSGSTRASSRSRNNSSVNDTSTHSVAKGRQRSGSAPPRSTTKQQKSPIPTAKSARAIYSDLYYSAN